MPTDPKTPEERLSEARKECLLSICPGMCGGAADRVDRLARVARLVGRIQQTYYDCGNCGWTDTSERDRLLAELNGQD